MDNKFIIDNLLMQNESEQLEFKAHYDEGVVAKHITAMLNSHGGTVLVGVDERKSIVGVYPDLDVTKILHSLMNKIRPSAPIDVQSVDYVGKRVLLISVWEGAQKPYLYEGVIYQKTDSEGSVTVIEWFKYPNFSEKKRYTYKVWQREGIWKIYDYTVVNLGTE